MAEVVEGYPPLIGDALLNGEPGLLLVVEKLPHVDARKVVQGLDAALHTLRQGLPGVETDSSIYGLEQNFLETAINNLSKALMIGAILLIIALLFVFYEWRAAIVSAIAVLLSMLAAGLVLYAYGATLNIMVLAGFIAALVVIVDDAVVDVERILRRLREENVAGRGRPVRAIVIESLAETRSPLPLCDADHCSARAPRFLMAGVAKPFFEPLAISLSACVVGIDGCCRDRYSGFGVSAVAHFAWRRGTSDTVAATPVSGYSSARARGTARDSDCCRCRHSCGNSRPRPYLGLHHSTASQILSAGSTDLMEWRSRHVLPCRCSAR